MMLDVLLLAEAIEQVIPLDESIHSDFRRRLEKAVDDYQELRASVIRIETRFVAAEERITEKLGDIADTLKSFSIIGRDIQELRITYNANIKEHDEFKELYTKSQIAIDKLQKKIELHDRIVSALMIIVSFLAMISIPVIAGWIKKLLTLP